MQRRVLLSGSILGGDHLAFGAALHDLEVAGSDLVQLDVADGIFTPTITFGEELVRRVRQETELPLEVHLMVSRPQDWFETMGNAGADVALFHVEVSTRLFGLVQQARRFIKKVGIVLNTETSPEAARYIMPYVDVVMVMGIAPGFAGQEFVPNTLDKIRELARMRETLASDERPLLSVDGGVTEENAAALAKAGVDILVASSAIYGAPSPEMGGQGLREAIDGADLAPRPWLDAYIKTIDQG